MHTTRRRKNPAENTKCRPCNTTKVQSRYTEQMQLVVPGGSREAERVLIVSESRAIRDHTRNTSIVLHLNKEKRHMDEGFHSAGRIRNPLVSRIRSTLNDEGSSRKNTRGD